MPSIYIESKEWYHVVSKKVLRNTSEDNKRDKFFSGCLDGKGQSEHVFHDLRRDE